ncbi:hypothetical protein HK096_005305, partial [Nowakowskiella sp. JEL0078]
KFDEMGKKLSTFRGKHNINTNSGSKGFNTDIKDISASTVEFISPSAGIDLIPNDFENTEFKKNLILNDNNANVNVLTDVKTESEVTVALNEKIATNWKPEQSLYGEGLRFDNNRKFHGIEDSPYPLPADLEEHDRLEIQHIIIKHSFGRLFTMPIVELLSESGTKVLDVGCGPGSWVRDIATTYPQADVHAVDIVKSLFDGVESLPNITFASGNVLEQLPYSDNCFDAVLQRFLTGGIPKVEWDKTILELYRVTKPGGYIELIEPDVCQKLGSMGEILIGGIYKVLKLRGLDVEFASHMKSRIEGLGLNVESETVRLFPIGWEGKFGDMNKRNLEMFAYSMKPLMMKSLEVTNEKYDEMVNEMKLEFSENQTFFNVHSVVIKKKYERNDILVNEKIVENCKLEKPQLPVIEDTRNNTLLSHSGENNIYSLPADIVEQDRLELQHIIVKQAFGELFKMPIKDLLLIPDKIILDVGCGSGAWTRDVATTYPNVKLHSILLRALMQKILVPDNYFDAVFQRFLTIGIQKIKWDDAINELKRVVKPGGFIELVEYEEAQNFGPTGLILIESILETLGSSGIDRQIAVNMKTRMENAGLNIQSENIYSLP